MYRKLTGDALSHGRSAPRRRQCSRRRWRRCAALAAVPAVLLIPRPAVQPAAAAGVTIASSLRSGQPVGTLVTWTAHAEGLKHPRYQFSVATAGRAAQMVRDYSPTPSFTWAPLHEGTYTVRVTAEDGYAATSTTSASAAFTLISRVRGQNAVVSATANPLVALYSAPACATRGSMVVQFRPASGSTWQSSAAQPCDAGASVNVLVAGMRPRTSYLLRDVVTSGKTSTTSATHTFTTGAPEKGLQIASFSLKQAPTSQADGSMPIVFHALNPDPSPVLANPLATDLSGQLVWYYDALHAGLTEIWPVRMLSDGTFLMLGLDRYHKAGDDVLREVNLAGTVVRETNIDAVDAQLARRGQEPIYAFHHDAMRLPNGDTAVLGMTQRKVDGHDVTSDMIVVLDSNFQVAWSWDLLDHITPAPSTLTGLSCSETEARGLCAVPDPRAVDWSHANGLGWATDDDLTLSIRMLDMVIKIDYQNGHGSGAIVWRLGKGGDFSLKSSVASPWFSHQHNAYFVDATTMVLFDNGNTRCAGGTVSGCDSRGQVWTLDQQHHVATLRLNADLGRYWQALGSAQQLANGDFYFAGGLPYKGPAPNSSEEEFRANGTKVYELDSTFAEYRAYRVGDLSS